MGTLTLSGNLVSGPKSGSDAASLPRSVTTIPLLTLAATLGWTVESGTSTRVVASPSSFVVLSGVGATDTVTKAKFLLLFTSAPIDVKFTLEDASTPVITINGVSIIQFSDSKRLTGLSVQGAGTVEWYLCGDL